MSLPVVVLSYVPSTEPLAIEKVSEWVALTRHMLEKEFSREWLETELRNGLREGRLSLANRAVEAADKGDEIADAALRDVAAELQTRLVQKQDLADGHLQVIAYLQRAATRAPHKRPRGQRWYNNWSRDIHIALLIALASVEFDVSPTRNRESRRAKRRPSAVSLVVAGLERGNNFHIAESSVQRNIWLGLPGELVRGILSRGIAPTRNDLAVCK